MPHLRQTQVWLHFWLCLVILMKYSCMKNAQKQTACLNEQGFTLMELLIVIVILMLLAIILFINIRIQYMKGNDTKRKTDLGKIQKVLEEYYNDKSTYPAASPIDNCGSADLKPYLEKVPCDPTKKIPYLFVPGIPTPRDGYVVCTQLEYTSDPDITRIGCTPAHGCGWAPGYNYCIAVGTTIVAPGYDPATGDEGAANGATPTPTPGPGIYACTPGGDCNDYGGNAAINGCPFTYDSKFCVYNGVNQCLRPANRCKF
jgi:type II secretory pathway pseudopilin PulG